MIDTDTTTDNHLHYSIVSRVHTVIEDVKLPTNENDLYTTALICRFVYVRSNLNALIGGC